MRDPEVKNTENHCSKQSPVVSGLFTSIESSIITKHYGPYSPYSCRQQCSWLKAQYRKLYMNKSLNQLVQSQHVSCLCMNPEWHLQQKGQVHRISVWLHIAHVHYCVGGFQSQDPSFQPSRHLSSTLLQSNSGLPNRMLMSLWRRHIHCERLCWLLVSGWFVFNLDLRSSAHSSHGKTFEKRLMNCVISPCCSVVGASG